jgi:O-antigen biosynthesis protein
MMPVTSQACATSGEAVALVDTTTPKLNRVSRARDRVTAGQQPSSGRVETASPIARWRCARLWLRVQMDAFQFDPLGYLQAVAWRARGLRVRSRNRVAALAGRSASAYELWMSCREPKLRPKLRTSDRDVSQIIPVIDCSQRTDGIEHTLASLPGHVHPIVVGAEVYGATSIKTIADLPNCLGTGEAWICPLEPGDRLASDALAIYGDAIAADPQQQLLYADDDLINEHGVRTQPHFKPDWNPELFEHHDYLTGAGILKFRGEDRLSLSGRGWAQALVKRTLERSPAPAHLPFFLHHRRARPQPLIPSKTSPLAATSLPPVSAIIPTRNGADLLRNCLDGLSRTDYPHLEIIVVDNDSDERRSLELFEELRSTGIRVIRIEGEFNYSALNNAAVEAAQGESLCFLNNDIEVLDGDWLQWLIRHAVRPEIGAVGARLLYPDGTVQHAGVFTGIGGGAAHAHRFLGKDERGYFDRARLPQRVSAVTGACLAVSRDKFLAVGGFDEKDFRVAFNDIDLCLKLNQRGWQSFYEPRATLIHHESKSRGSDRARVNRARFAEELAALKRKWRTDQRRDPFHHPQLSPFCEQFVIAI